MKGLLLFAIILVSLPTLAQDPQFSQYYAAPLYLNPGFAGLTPQQRFVVNYRIQWPNLPQAFSTFAFSYDLYVNELNSGFGLLVTNDKMGSAGWKTTTTNVIYSYKIRLTDKVIFSPGLSFGYGTNGIDRSKLRLGDGLEYDGVSLDPELYKLGKQNYFDFGSGFLFYSRTFWLGASFAHMNQPNLSVLNDVSRLSMKTAIHAGAKLLLGQRYLNSNREDYLTPSFIYRMQGGSFSQLDLGINYHIDPVSVGVWYRGKPFSQTMANSIQQDALILNLGLYLKNLTIGYSYDFTTSRLNTASGGAHEISIVYELVAHSAERSARKKQKLIPCPTFNNKSQSWGH